MDIVREDISQKKKRRRFVLAGAGVAAVLLITLGLSRLKPAAPTVDKATVLIDVVKRGPMERQVRGPDAKKEKSPQTEQVKRRVRGTDTKKERKRDRDRRAPELWKDI